MDKKIENVNKLIDMLNNMKKPELVEFARKYNHVVKLSNIHKMKKQDLITELLNKSEEVMMAMNKIEAAEPKKTKKTKKQMSDDDQNKLIKEAIELTKKALAAEDSVEKAKLLKQADVIQKKLLK